jgi:hypothetical protein
MARAEGETIGQRRRPSAVQASVPASPAAAPRALERARALASTRRFQTIAAGLAYLAFAVFLTWPLVLHFDSAIYGPVGDGTGAVSTMRELIEGRHFPFAPGTISDFAAPGGLDIRWNLNVSTFPSFGSLYALTAVFGQIAALNLYTLLGFTLSGLSTFLLVRRIVGSAPVAFIAGYAYAFYPFVVVSAQGHPDFVHGWVFVVLLWRLLELMERPSVRNGVWAGLALVLIFAWTPYHILFGAVMAASVGAVALVVAWRRGLLRPAVTALAVAGAIGLAWLGAIVVLNATSSRSEVRTHTINEVIAYSARAPEYVVPTGEQPFFGDRAQQYRSQHLHGSNASENTLYLGVTVLLLALVGFVASVLRPGSRRRVALATGAMAAAAFAFSAPPHVKLLGVDLPTPTQLVFDITTTWRVFSRFAMVVMLGVVILAALGVDAITRRRAAVVQGALLVLILAAIGADLWARPAQGVNEFTVPEAYHRLAGLPEGIAAEYPLLPAAQSQFGDTFWQSWYDKPVVNGYLEGSPEEGRALRLGRLSDPATARGLKALGVRYILLRHDLVAAGLSDPGRPGGQFRALYRDPQVSLYELKQPGQAVLVSPMEGFSPTESGAGGLFQWMVKSRGTIELRGTCTHCAGEVRVDVGTFVRPRRVAITGPAGQTLARAFVPKTKELRFPVRFDRTLELTVSSAPGPQSITDTTGQPDPRSIGISVGRTSFTFARGGGR